MNRRAEVIDLKQGAVFARTCGDPANPLVLYVHDGATSTTSQMWNPLMSALSIAKRECHTKAAEIAREAHTKDTRPRKVDGDGSGKDVGGRRRDGRSSGAASSGRSSTSASGESKDDGGDGTSGLEKKVHKLNVASSKADKGTSGGRAGRGSGTAEANAGSRGFGAGEDPDKEDVEYDDRFAAVRGAMSTSLLRRQKELMQTLCSLCSSLLLQPTRLASCRHVLCALCVERSVLYHRECPVCSAPIDASPKTDFAHDAVMQTRMWTMKDHPPMVVAWRLKLDEHIADRRSCTRVVIEYGSSLSASGGAFSTSPRGAKQKCVLYVAVLRDGDAGGALVHEGPDVRQPHAQEWGQYAASVVSEVTFDYNPESGDDIDSTLTVQAPNVARGPCQVYHKYASDDRIGYAVTRPMLRGAPCHITIHVRWRVSKGERSAAMAVRPC